MLPRVDHLNFPLDLLLPAGCVPSSISPWLTAFQKPVRQFQPRPSDQEQKLLQPSSNTFGRLPSNDNSITFGGMVTCKGSDLERFHERNMASDPEIRGRAAVT